VPLTLASWSDLFQGTEAAPWLWWAVALVLLLGGLVLGMRLLGLFPE
jgi:heme exporter protein D